MISNFDWEQHQSSAKKGMQIVVYILIECKYFEEIK